jgi:DUF4097 and DUF4098 domain-containing protein YvlB
MNGRSLPMLIAIILCITAISAGCLDGDDGATVSDERNFSGSLSSEEVLLTVDNLNGEVEVSTWSDDSYDIEIKMKAKGDTEEEAQERLDALIINFDESSFQGRRELSLNYDLPFSFVSFVEIDVRVRLPKEASIDLDIETSNGDVVIEEIRGRLATVETSNGNLELNDVTATEISASTSNGRITGQLESSEAVLVSSNGRIELALPGMFSGTYVMTTSNSDIRLTVPDSTAIGYDLDLVTGNGDVVVELEDMVYIVDDDNTKEGITEGFDGKDVQMVIDATTSNGDIEIMI